jgi:AraC family transcriptional regulator
MLNSSSSIGVKSFASGAPLPWPATFGGIKDVGALRLRQPVDISFATVGIAPSHAVTRRGLEWHGMGAETVRVPANHRVDYRFRSPLHLLAAYEQGERRDGESYVEGASRSKLRDIAKKLTFVPAGCEYHEWHDTHTPMSLTYLYFDAAGLQIEPGQRLADLPLAPRLFFEDATIWSTAAKLRQVIDAQDYANRLYVDALGVVLLHELVHLERRRPRAEAPVRGGLAAWQQRIVFDYIEEHLSEQIPLATLAHLARLSPFHFCRAFKRSFGVSPHRYHTGRRVEQAKILLAARKDSMTKVALTVGFGETSSFTAMFRKFTGQTPSGYRRALE